MKHHKTAFRWVAAIALFGCGWAQAGIRSSRHDFTATGSGPVKSIGETEVCKFCHSPHSTAASAPLWKRSQPVLSYTLYSSSTRKSLPGQPTYASKVCLSCHDGTIAMGSVSNRATPMAMSGAISGRANLTTNLSDDHPISFVYDSSLAGKNPELANPATLAESVHLDPHGQLQCTTCHDPHASTNPKFLVKDNAYSALCVTCHIMKGWAGSAHAVSMAGWNRMGTDPWPHTEWTTVAANGCENCHAPHGAGQAKELLNFPTEEGNCLPCHNGNVSRKNIEAEIQQKRYTHPVRNYLQIHDPVENFSSMARHVECQDCHDPHMTTATMASAPNAGGPLTGVAGVTAAGTRLEKSNYEYEVCFRCHADSPNGTAPYIQRQVFQSNIRLKFQVANPSFHPVAGPGRNAEVTSLVTPWRSASRIYCTDCHANDAGPGAGGTGPRGPHGSIWPYLLERQYMTADNTTESIQAYALCYKCHDRASILGDRSFPHHNKHIVKQRTPCSACHDPHGISSTQGNALNHSNLINFDKTIALRDSATQRLEFEDLGTRHGRCTLRCHGKDHNTLAY